jgi:tripartite-type tricarboxylate transporter receptor subunit TctC
MFRIAAGIKAEHVGFRSSAGAMIEVVSGRVNFAVLPVGTGLPFLKEGKLLALAVADERSPLLPGVPAMHEVLPKYERSGSYGLFAPAGTPRNILLQINSALRRVLTMPDIQAHFQAMAFAATPTTPEEFDRITRSDIATYSKLLKSAGLHE